ncbi:Os04g0420500 [Oryza sativa Japonica Group]|uniref:Os04g0420500 protein n=2 Tax=Oryza sativa subsp. japonica TaxID=39947 RepID=Q0JD91_ORYSJ|nr:Os04g0420500 [Oryza sativa Japonica Group]BAS89189.1 Os04g0420500 [Oryza sativa Japonica Group]|eukprot:NP_001052782.1 Os04g0420500 [Oryza sativa Japonica Group]
MTRFPSPEIVASGEVGPVTGSSPLATHAGVSFGTWLNHIPRYQFEALWEDLLLVGKKPSANLPLLETSMSLPASVSPAEMVSVTLQDAGMCSVKRRNRTVMGRAMVNKSRTS